MDEESNLNTKSLLGIQDKYKDILEDKLDVIFKKYFDLLNEFINLFIDTHQIGNINNLNNLYYLLLNGIKTITHVYNYILLYTNNLNLADFYFQKAYYLYTEFISQIDNLDNAYLKLNGKDATIFVYKKTIYEINNNRKENFKDNQKNKFKVIKSFFDFINQLYEITLIDEIIINNKESFLQSKKIINNIYKILVEIFSLELYQIDNYKWGIDLITYLDKFLNLCINSFSQVENSSFKIKEYIIILLTKIKKINW